MLIKFATRILSRVLLTMCFLGCTKKAAEEIDFGTLKNSVYHIEYFGFWMNFPKEWSVQDHRMQQQLMKRGANYCW